MRVLDKTIPLQAITARIVYRVLYIKAGPTKFTIGNFIFTISNYKFTIAKTYCLLRD